MARATPGPWHIGVNTAQRDTAAGDEFLGIGTDSGRVICRITALDLEDEEDGFNAALIAAAPDLLAVCIEALAEGRATGYLRHPTANKMAAAIAKAEPE